MAKVLVVGFGNALRGDDGLGLRVIQALRPKVNPDLVELMELHQLGPELAETTSKFELVIFVDASMQGAAGTVRSRKVLPKKGPRTESHVFDPSAVLNLAQNLYGHAPETLVVTITGAFFGFATELTQIVELAVPAAADNIQREITKRFGEHPVPNA